MDELQRLVIENACRNLSIAYAKTVDFKEYDAFVELFDDNAYLYAGVALEGKEGIQRGMAKRSDTLRSRHVLTNILIDVIDENHATGVTYLTLYRHIGAESLELAPILVAGPAGVGHYSDEFIRTETGWRFARRVLEFAFQNPEAFP